MNVTGKALPGTHYFAEEIPDVVATALREFFKGGGPEGPPSTPFARPAPIAPTTIHRLTPSYSSI